MVLNDNNNKVWNENTLNCIYLRRKTQTLETIHGTKYTTTQNQHFFQKYKQQVNRKTNQSMVHASKDTENYTSGSKNHLHIKQIWVQKNLM